MAIGPQDNLLKILLSPKCNSCNKQTNATIPQTMQVLEAIADVYQGWVGRGEGENPRDPPLTQLTQKCTIMQHCTMHKTIQTWKQMQQHMSERTHVPWMC